MALFTITTLGYINQPPSQIGNNSVEIPIGGSHVFTLANFTTETNPQYLDPEGDSVSMIKIVSISGSNISVKLSGIDVIPGQEIPASEIALGNLTAVDDGINNSYHNLSLTFNLSDTGSNTFSSGSGIMTVEAIEEVNSPPTSVGNRTEEINYGDTLVFNRDMFTTLTTPQYSDPENDPAGSLKITSLPNLGSLKLNGNAISANQVIDFSDIDLGLLTYNGNTSNVSASETDFEFEIADTVSGIFVG